MRRKAETCWVELCVNMRNMKISESHFFFRQLSAARGVKLLPRCAAQRPRITHKALQGWVWRRSSRGSGMRVKSERASRSSGQQQATPLLQASASLVARPIFFLLATAGFAATSADLFAPWGARWLLNHIDQPAHLWVVEHLSKFVRDLVFEIGVSNISIVFGCLGWALCSSILFNDAIDERKENANSENSPPASVQLKSLGSTNFKRLIALWTLYFSAGGFLLPGDNFLVSFFKHTFNRVRPSTRHKSFSFPSGHTTAVTYIVGILLFALLPYLLELLEVRSREPNKVAKLGILSQEGIQKLVRSVTQNGGKLWGFAIASTAGGRVLGDVHWVSDTIAGACLGSAVVSGYLIVSHHLQFRQKARDSES